MRGVSSTFHNQTSKLPRTWRGGTHSPRVTVGDGSFSMAPETLSAFSGNLILSVIPSPLYLYSFKSNLSFLNKISQTCIFKYLIMKSSSPLSHLFLGPILFPGSNPLWIFELSCLVFIFLFLNNMPVPGDLWKIHHLLAKAPGHVPCENPSLIWKKDRPDKLSQ